MYIIYSGHTHLPYFIFFPPSPITLFQPPSLYPTSVSFCLPIYLLCDILGLTKASYPLNSVQFTSTYSPGDNDFFYLSIPLPKFPLGISILNSQWLGYEKLQDKCGSCSTICKISKDCSFKRGACLQYIIANTRIG